MFLIIPCYNPTPLFQDTFKDLDRFPELQAVSKIIVNDGSTKNTHYFDEVKNRNDVTLLVHDKNVGKGAALKTAFQYLIDKKPDVDFAITVDADFQHKAKDVIKLLHEIIKNGNQEKFVIGVRDFNMKNTVGRSYLGNRLSLLFFNFMYQVDLRDNQSGLRGYSKKLYMQLLSTKSNRYEFETEAIIHAIKKKFHIQQIPIETHYYQKNASSHFKPIKDSLKIIKVMLKR